MNKIFTGVVLVAAFSCCTVFASESGTDKCQGAYTLAEKVMEARQEGIPMPRMIEIADGDQLIIELTKEAYDTPRFSSENYKRNKIQDFANEVYLLCLKNLDSTP